MNIESHTPDEVFYLPQTSTPVKLVDIVEEDSLIDARPVQPLARIVYRSTTLYGEYTPRILPDSLDICYHCQCWSGDSVLGCCTSGRQRELLLSFTGWPWCSQYVPNSYLKNDQPPQRLAYTLSVELQENEVPETAYFCERCFHRGNRYHVFEARADILSECLSRVPYFHVVPSVVSRCTNCLHATVLQREDELQAFDLVLVKRLCSYVFARDSKRTEWSD